MLVSEKLNDVISHVTQLTTAHPNSCCTLAGRAYFEVCVHAACTRRCLDACTNMASETIPVVGMFVCDFEFLVIHFTISTLS